MSMKLIWRMPGRARDHGAPALAGALAGAIALTLPAPPAALAAGRSGVRAPTALTGRTHRHAWGRAFEPATAFASAPAALGSGEQPCNGERVPPYSACVAPYTIGAAESRLIAGEGEGPAATAATVCVYLSSWDGRSFVWDSSPVSCNSEPTLYTHGYAGQPTIYNDSGSWITAGFADIH
jgi:hypothetical protein